MEIDIKKEDQEYQEKERLIEEKLEQIIKIVESIKCKYIVAKYIVADEALIVIMDDYESNYHEVAVIQEEIVTFFGEPFGNPTITLDQYLANLKFNWIEVNNLPTVKAGDLAEQEEAEANCEDI